MFKRLGKPIALAFLSLTIHYFSVAVFANIADAKVIESQKIEKSQIKAAKAKVKAIKKAQKAAKRAAKQAAKAAAKVQKAAARAARRAAKQAAKSARKAAKQTQNSTVAQGVVVSVVKVNPIGGNATPKPVTPPTQGIPANDNSPGPVSNTGPVFEVVDGARIPPSVLAEYLNAVRAHRNDFEFDYDLDYLARYVAETGMLVTDFYGESGDGLVYKEVSPAAGGGMNLDSDVPIKIKPADYSVTMEIRKENDQEVIVIVSNNNH